MVLGATGGTGLEIVRQAIARGHAVTALARSPEKLQSFEGWISVQRGDLLDSVTLERVMRKHDAVISAFGPRVPVARSEAHLLEQFAVAVTTAMRRAEVRRVVVESVAFLFKDSVMPPAYLLGRLLFPITVADAWAMERVFGESGLDWTIVRPPELTNGAYTGKYRVREAHLPRFGFKVSRADVADFMIRTAENQASTGKVF
ncbi:MAG TPA: NAD(P)H-binding protein, partial [Terriglobales bacterium]|nr:NAD(P)H-binding protein [Terriglobales bacterium]